MNVFVLCTGRCGSNTFTKACTHITNFSSGHETRVRQVGTERIAYPDDHIEVDHYLSWFLGRLHDAYGDEAYYVHLIRDPEKVARTWARWWSWQGSTPTAFRNAFLKMTDAPWLECCRDYVDTQNENIRLFMRDKTNTMTVHVENIEEDFSMFWKWIGAEGDLNAAMHEWSIRHNETPSEIRMCARVIHNTVGKMIRCYR